MLTKLLGGLDLGKLSLNAVSGFIAGVAVLLLVDAITPGHLAKNLLEEKPAGTLVVYGIIVVLGSVILGPLVNILFHTFGRWFAAKIWFNLHRVFEFRNTLMKNLGLYKAEFIWVQSKDKDKDRFKEIDNRYMQFTEAGGSSAYSTWLLAIAIGLFFYYELDYSWWQALIVSALFACIATVLLLTSAASLAKYEMNKTMSAMDEIRSMGSHNVPPSDDVESPHWYCFRKNGKWKDFHFWWDRHFLKDGRFMVVSFFAIPVIIVAIILLITSQINQTSVIKIIGSLGDDSGIPMFEINIANQTVQYASSAIIKLDDDFEELVLDDAYTIDGVVNLVKTTDLPSELGWSLGASLSNTTVNDKRSISLNLLFYSKTTPSPSGNWTFPVLVSERDQPDTKYLLTYVKVTINPQEDISIPTLVLNITADTDQYASSAIISPNGDFKVLKLVGSLDEKIVRLFKGNPDSSKVENFAEKSGMTTDIANEKIYNILSDLDDELDITIDDLQNMSSSDKSSEEKGEYYQEYLYNPLSDLLSTTTLAELEEKGHNISVIDLVQTIDIPGDELDWSLEASISNITIGDRSVVLNVLFSSSSTPVTPGNWIFPILAYESSDTSNPPEEYLIAYVKVIITTTN